MRVVWHDDGPERERALIPSHFCLRDLQGSVRSHPTGQVPGMRWSAVATDVDNLTAPSPQALISDGHARTRTVDLCCVKAAL